MSPQVGVPAPPLLLPSAAPITLASSFKSKQRWPCPQSGSPAPLPSTRLTGLRPALIKSRCSQTFSLQNKAVTLRVVLRSLGQHHLGSLFKGSIPASAQGCWNPISTGEPTFFKIIYLFIYLAASGLRCGTQDLRCRIFHAHRPSSCGVRASVVVASRFSCSGMCGI